MTEKGNLNSGIPSAPLEENSSNTIDDSASPVSYQQSIPVHRAMPFPASFNTGLLPLSEPPPSYQATMAYPATMPYSSNSDNRMSPKTSDNVTPCPLLPVSNQTLPPPSATPAMPSASSQLPTVAISSREYCAYCRAEIVSAETDLCCLIFLILLAVFTFPIGLLYLCFIPCATRKRCSHCRRIR